MGNLKRGIVDLKIGEETYSLRFSINVCCELEERLGDTISGIANTMADEKKLSISLVRTLFWHAIKENHDVSKSEAGEIMSDGDFVEIMGAVGKAFEAAFPKPDAKKNP